MRHVHDGFHRIVVPRYDNANVDDLHSGVHSPLRRPHALEATAHYDWSALGGEDQSFRFVEWQTDRPKAFLPISMIPGRILWQTSRRC